MTFSFRPAKRENVSLIIGLAGGTGSGKTFSAMRLASGISGDKPFAVIDTEAGRAKHYADQFKFDHGDLMPPFRPDAYVEAIMAADKAGYPVIVVDSVSHVWAGDGGVLDWQDDELDRMAGDDWKKREACKMAAWIKPKMSHKAMVQKLLQVRAHLILCFRAEEKIEMVREDGKMKIIPKVSPVGIDGWMPVCEKNLPYELTISLLLRATAPGMPNPIKLQEQHKALFPLNKPVDEASGKRIAQWAKGSATEPAPPPKVVSPNDQAPASAVGADQKAAGPVGCDQTTHPSIAGQVPAAPDSPHAKRLQDALKHVSPTLNNRFKAQMLVKGYKTIDGIPADKVDGLIKWLSGQADAEIAAAQEAK
jgi:hypothetical protein